jgi:histidinol dehydrogenase
MIQRTFQYHGPESLREIADWLDERNRTDNSVGDAVADIIADVATRGDEAIVHYTRRFDCPDFMPEMIAVDPERLEAALDELPEEDVEIIIEAAENIAAFHEEQVEKSWMTTRHDGAVLGQLVRPVRGAGLYVPGGQGGETPLVSSLLMTAIPAQVAGVDEICVVSPPRADGTLNPYILGTAALLGLQQVFAVGSAWAIAALAHGSASIPQVDVVAGPGNIFVTEAKRQLIGRIGIDMIAGPSEIAILADETATPAWLAADLLSQAEHDPLAAAVLVTTDAALGERTMAELTAQLEALPRNSIARECLECFGAVIVVEDLAAGLEVVDLLAPEHLELCVDDPWPLLGSIRNAGAIFMGHHCPEPVGDYFAGPNHVLPTMGTARFSQALSVETFTKKASIIATPPSYLDAHGAKIARLARLEGLEAHARSAECRRED